ncbi:hypothetical protein CYY_007929 [Polysphondylium violaceum]|uniref:Uncharacterized protein n=1 Tax=Polysphondylium violaceum TaxID=133409 RepID=A0A8J4PP23_9MYCE|nr:hypothetical protein CYY_007929 [Polysphondylium violaceum]
MNQININFPTQSCFNNYFFTPINNPFQQQQQQYQQQPIQYQPQPIQYPHQPIVNCVNEEECIQNLCSLKEKPATKKRSYVKRKDTTIAKTKTPKTKQPKPRKPSEEEKKHWSNDLLFYNPDIIKINSLINHIDKDVHQDDDYDCCSDDDCFCDDEQVVVVGTHSNPFPNLNYKLESALVKMNENGQFDCPYPGCGKVINGNRGNVSSHLRYHMKFIVPKKPVGGIEQLYLPTGKVRGAILRGQMEKYGSHSFRKDAEGRYVCFFKNCEHRMLTNFSRHVHKHENNGDLVQENLSLVLNHNPIVNWVYHYPHQN